MSSNEDNTTGKTGAPPQKGIRISLGVGNVQMIIIFNFF